MGADKVSQKLTLESQKRIALLARIAVDKHSELYSKVRSALRQRDYTEVDRLLDESVAMKGGEG